MVGLFVLIKNFFCSAGDGTRGLGHAGPVLYTTELHPSLRDCLNALVSISRLRDLVSIGTPPSLLPEPEMSFGGCVWLSDPFDVEFHRS